VDHVADRARVPAWARRFVAVYLAAFLVCGLLGFEAWPLTGWRLFSDARQARQSGWQAVTVDGAGRETPLPFRDLPAGFQGDVQVLKGFPDLSPGERAAVCLAWADAVDQRHGRVEAVRVYRTETDLSHRVGERGAPPDRTLYWTCRLGGAGAPG